MLVKMYKILTRLFFYFQYKIKKKIFDINARVSFHSYLTQKCQSLGKKSLKKKPRKRAHLHCLDFLHLYLNLHELNEVLLLPCHRYNIKSYIYIN